VLLTGAGGFVGQHLVPALAAAGWTVRAVSRRAPEDLPPGAEHRSAGDLARPVDWAPLLDGVDAVVHAAAIAHTTGVEDALYTAVNTRATLDLAAAAKARSARFVFLSSVRAQCGPVSAAVLTEEDPPVPTDAYGRSKLEAERGLARLDMAWTALRPVVVYGPGVRGNVGALQRLAGLPLPLPFGGLTARRSFCSVWNLASAVALALEGGVTGPVLVADPVPSSLAELVAAMRAAQGRGAGLVGIPPELLGSLARLAGQGSAWERLAGPMEVSTGKLSAAGWRPPSATTPEGVRRWLGQPPRG
jgi:UDP-glucose 4-epimerase